MTNIAINEHIRTVLKLSKLMMFILLQVGKKKEHATRTPNSPPGLFFRHAGHRDKVVDFHWNAAHPCTIVSVSDDCETSGGGGTLQTKDPNTAFRVELVDAPTPQRSSQIWRMSDLIYRPEGEVLAERKKYMSHVIGCTSKS